jgi:hypothetical protein
MLNAATTLLDGFSKLPARVERPPTFMEIAGYPHYENVCSNILAFFLDPEEPHGLETLVLDAFAYVGGIAAAGEGMGGNVSVEREVITDTGNRIDILIESDTHAVIIENKIFAGAGNPFADYTAYLNRRTPGDRRKHELLLTLSPTNEGSKWGFTNLTYAEFVGQIRSMLGHYVSGADTRYLTMYLDFLNTLENLQGEPRMDQGLVTFLSERTDDAENFFAELMRFKDELRKKVRELGSLIDLGKHKNVQQFFYRERRWLKDILIHDIRVSEDTLIRIDTYVGPQGWGIYIWPRQGDRSKLRDLLHLLEIPSEEKGRGFVHSANFTYNENLDNISPVLQDLVDKLATGRARTTDPQAESATSDHGPIQK